MLDSNFKINDRVAWMSSLDVGGSIVEFVGTIVELGLESVDTLPDGRWIEGMRTPAAKVRPDPQHGLTKNDIDHPNGPAPTVKLRDLRRL